MGFLRNAGATVAGGVLTAGGVEYLKNTTPSSEYGDIVGNVANEVGNILQQGAAYIGDTAPIALEQFVQNFGADEVLFGGGATLLAGWGGKKASELTGKIIGVESKTDDSIASLGGAAFAGLSVLGLAPAGLVVGVGAGTYVIGRKLGEKILGEKYAKLVGGMSALAASSATLGIASTILPGLLIAGGAGLIWKKGVTPFHNWKTERNEKNREQRKERNQKIAAGRRKRIEARESAKKTRLEKRKSRYESRDSEGSPSKGSPSYKRKGPRRRPSSLREAIL